MSSCNSNYLKHYMMRGSFVVVISSLLCFTTALKFFNINQHNREHRRTSYASPKKFHSADTTVLLSMNEIDIVEQLYSLGLSQFQDCSYFIADASESADSFFSTGSSLQIAAVDVTAVVQVALRKAFDGGSSGASAAFIQVVSLMWLRTAINYQYRYGTSASEALRRLYQEGGIPRLYQGLPFAALQGPLARFGDTAANSLVYSLCESFDPTGSLLPIYLKTGLASVGAGAWRIILMPVDTVKTCLQVDGPEGWKTLQKRVQKEGFSVLFNGAIAASAATFVGHYPWFVVYNYLSTSLLSAEQFTDMVHHDSSSLIVLQLLGNLDVKALELLRTAFIGLCASCTSDVCSNSLRVLKTARQTMSSSNPSVDDDGDGRSDKSLQMSYVDIAKTIVREEGWQGLFGRGLQTRLLSNALQGMLFSVLFKYFQSFKGS